MALTRPILYSIPAFDATESYIFTFNVIGGDQVVKNKLVITDQDNDQIVYQGTQITFSFNHTLSSNVLTNGHYYSAYIITYNTLDEESQPSNGIQFYCFTTPSFSFNNFPVSGVVNNSSFRFEVTYNQNEGELLSNYTFNLYNLQNELISTSGMQYVGSSQNLPLMVSHLFSSLLEGNVYKIQVIGQTQYNTQIHTDILQFSVVYTTPDVFSILQLTNNCEGGYIVVRSALTSIIGESNPSPPLYIDGNTAVDFREHGSYVIWDTNFNISDDFTASLWGRDFNDNSTIITMSDGFQVLTIRYWKNENNFCYAELIVQEGSIIYYIYSNPVYVYPNDEIQIWFRRIGYLYEIGLYDLTERSNLFLDSPINGLIGVHSLR